MPGLVERSINGNMETHSESAAPNGKAVKSEIAQMDDPAPKMNGIHPAVNGVVSNGVLPRVTSDHAERPDKTTTVASRLPPEIEHVTLGYRPLSTLISRLAQETFTGLRQAIDEMAKIPLQQPQVNGTSHALSSRGPLNAPSDDSPPNVHKKSYMFDFANSRRAQFIKVLVLSKWARQAEAIDKVIDLRIWLVQKQEQYSSAVHWMGVLKRNLAPLTEPSPDIKTALEILSLGRASWIPTFTYLPPPELTPRQILDGLKRIDSLLSIRLNLHDDLPPQFKNFSINSGRATFAIQDEFEVDISVADEEITSQFWFIDFRMTFSPTPDELPKGVIRAKLELFANEKLGREGVVGLLSYLHELTMTQKLLLLRNQAYEMARSHWSGHIKIEPVRRALVIQYWCERPGAKSWIELGISKREAATPGSLAEDRLLPEIALRWFRAGREVSNLGIDIHLRLGDLSIRHILEQVIARHTSLILTDMARQLGQAGLFSSGSLKLKQLESSPTNAGASLLVQLTAASAVKLIKEPVSGRMALLPFSDLHAQAELELNRLASVSTKGASQVLFLRSLAAHAAVNQKAHSLGFEPVSSYNPKPEVFKSLFPLGTQKASYIKRSSWSANFILAYTTSAHGDAWWVIEIGDGTTVSDSINVPDRRLRDHAVKVISPAGNAAVFEPSNGALLEIEQAAVGIISQAVNIRYLLEARIPHVVQEPPLVELIQLPRVYMQISAHSAASGVDHSNIQLSPSGTTVAKLKYEGLGRNKATTLHTAITSIAQPFTNMKNFAIHMRGTKIDAASNRLLLRIQSPIGKTLIPSLTHRISAIGRLHEFINIITSQPHLNVEQTSLERIIFTYQQAPSLKASILLPSTSPERLCLSSRNPHNRIVDHLNTVLRTQGLVEVLGLMSSTSSLLTSFTWLERHRPCANRASTARSTHEYHVRYSAPTITGGFIIRLRFRRDIAEWHIPEDSIIKTGPGIAENDWQSNLHALTRGRGNGWRGMKGGIIAQLSGIREVLEKLDTLYLDMINSSPAYVSGRSRPGKRKAEGDVVELD